jgi:hypothetical protein
MTLFLKWKKMEPGLTSVAKLVPISTGRPSSTRRSLLDVTTIRYGAGVVDESQKVLGFVARRPIRLVDINVFLNAIMHLGYCPLYSSASPPFVAPATYLPQTNITKVYRQFSWYEMSGFETSTNIASAVAYDGLIVPGAFPDQNPATPDPVGVAPTPLLPPPSPASSRSLEAAATDFLGLTRGKYGGLHWTAGVNTRVANPEMVKGRYIVPAQDEEDELYKAHDEAYFHAGGDASRIRDADLRLVESLGRLKNLSPFGRGAQIWFSNKHAPTRDEL